MRKYMLWGLVIALILVLMGGVAMGSSYTETSNANYTETSISETSIKVTPAGSVNQGTNVTITGFVQVKATGKPVTVGTVQIQQRKYHANKGDYEYVAIYAGQPGIDGKVSFTLDTSNLGGQTLLFRTYYIPASGSVHDWSSSSPTLLTIKSTPSPVKGEITEVQWLPPLLPDKSWNNNATIPITFRMPGKQEKGKQGEVVPVTIRCGSKTVYADASWAGNKWQLNFKPRDYGFREGTCIIEVGEDSLEIMLAKSPARDKVKPEDTDSDRDIDDRDIDDRDNDDRDKDDHDKTESKARDRAKDKKGPPKPDRSDQPVKVPAGDYN